MDLIFHIGTEKTGSTAIQNWLHHNSKKLRERSIWYSQSLGRPANTAFHLYGLGGGPDEGFLWHGAVTDEQKAALVEKTERAFRDEAAAARAAGCEIFIISSELCHSRLITLQSVERVRDLLRPLFDRITVYCFLRPQLDMCLSLASTRARVGGEVSLGWFENEMQTKDYFYNYEELLQKWAAAFGKPDITPIPYLRNQDVVSYIAAQLGVSEADFLPAHRTNEALDYRSMAVANALALKPYLPNGRPNRNANFFLDMLPVEEKLRIDRAFGQRLQLLFARSNAALVKEWPGIRLDDLEIRWESYPEKGNLDQINAVDKFGPTLRFIVQRFNALLWLEQAKRKVAESKVAETRGEIAAAIALCEEALTAAESAAEVASTQKPAKVLAENWERRIAMLKAKK